MSNTIRIEILEEEELLFLEKRLANERKEYLYGMNLMAIAAVAIPFIVALIYFIRFQETRIMLVAFVYSLCFTIPLFLIICYFSYMRSLYGLKRDINSGTKSIESCIITQKKYMDLNNTYHFYLNSEFKYSIEVSEEDYHLFEVNDEINIEYAKHAREYFGYF